MTVKEIKEFMRINKITQVELSEKSGLPLQTIRNIFSNPTQNLPIVTCTNRGKNCCTPDFIPQNVPQNCGNCKIFTLQVERLP